MERVLPVLLCLTASVSFAADPFSFSAAAAKEAGKATDEAQAVRALISVPCQQRLKDQKLLLLIAERSGDSWNTWQERYGPHFRAIEARLRALGLQTYTPEQVHREVAQAEIDAYFRNDPDTALAASKRLSAKYILRGDISTRAGVNPVVGVNEVAVSFGFTLSAANGRLLSQVEAYSDSYAGADPLGMALTLVQEQADELVARLYNDYCRKAATDH
jgi:hypothetical protein